MKYIVAGAFVIVIAITSIALYFIPWYAVELTRSDSCQKSLSFCRGGLLIYWQDFGKKTVYPPNLQALFKTKIFTEDHQGLFYCSSTKGSKSSYYNIYGKRLYTEQPTLSNQFDFCYLYNKCLSLSDKTILMYCPNYRLHDDRVPTLLANGKVEYIKWSSFKELFDKQVEILATNKVKFSFQDGIVD